MSVVSVAVTAALCTAVGSGYWTVFAAALVIALVGVAIAPRAVAGAARAVPAGEKLAA
ncbi:hypothetical protein [Nonomuraea sp. NPDC048916]|uniref:hypothetical protein n=1 Tax=Nonomuraea sp. NPDC048916 TaxID=3154232 RepID=UPI0033EBF973